ncbi:unnamed protein product [Schistosoma spindalis]|nr:unnamed protein product [Schistosoma spindale]
MSLLPSESIAEKYNYEFRDCDIVDLTEFSVTKTGDFLSSLPDSILSDDENDYDIENIQPSTTRTGSFTNTTIVGTCSDTETEKEEENEEEEKGEEKEKEKEKGEVRIESSLFNENSKMDFNNVKAALCSLEKSVSSWEKRRFGSLNGSNLYTSNSSSSSSSKNSPMLADNRNQSHMKLNNLHSIKKISHKDKWKSPIQISASKQRVIEWLKQQESFMSQFIM